MKKIIALLLITNIVSAGTLNFARRFGSNSPIYNTPLYFEQKPTKKPCKVKKVKKSVKQKHTSENF